jgi:hypothetical protein
MDRAERHGRLHGGSGLLEGRDAHEQGNHGQQRAPEPALILVHQRGGDRLLEAGPALLVVAHEEQHAHQRREHVLQYDALRHRRAGESHERRDIPDAEDEDDVRQDQQAHGLPEGVPHRLAGPHQRRSARKLTSASSCAADSV